MVTLAEIKEFFTLLFTHRQLLRDSEAARAALEAALQVKVEEGLNQDEKIAELTDGVKLFGNALAYLIQRDAEENEKFDAKPIKMPRQSYAEMQLQYEFSHNRRLQEIVSRQKAGIK